MSYSAWVEGLVNIFIHCLSSLSELWFPILFHFWQTFWCSPYLLNGWFFLAIYEVCIRLCISLVCNWVSIIAITIVTEIAHQPRSSFSGFYPCFQFEFPVFRGYLDKLYDFVIYNFKTVYYPFLSNSFLLSIHVTARFFPLVFFSLRKCQSMYNSSPIYLHAIFFCSSDSWSFTWI